MVAFLLRLISTPEPQRLRRGLEWLLGYVRPRWREILVLLMLSVFATLMVLVQPLLLKHLIDDGLLAANVSVVLTVAALMTASAVIGTLLSGLNRYLHTRLSGQILFEIRVALYRHLQQLSPRFFGQWRLGDLLSRLDGDVAEIQRFAIDSLFSSVSSVIGFIGALALMLTLSWKLTALLIVLVPLEILWLRWARRRVERETRQLREQSSDLSSFLVETLPATKFIQSSGQEPHEANRFRGLGASYLSQLLRLQVTEFATAAVPSTLVTISRAAVFVIGGIWVVQGTWQLGALIAFTTYLGMAVGPIQSLLGLYVALQRMSVSLSRVTELRDEPVLVSEPSEPRPLPVDGNGALQLQDVTFGHDGASAPILSGVTLLIPGRVRVGLSGASGVGKSTLIDLLQRFYDPDSGRILLDGIDLRDLSIAALRRAIAVVGQDTAIFRGSVTDNVAYGQPSVPRDRIEEVCRLAQLEDWIRTLPKGLDEIIGERGQRISGGQRQRIAVARALLQNPRILILDEATSAVDERTEQEVIKAIDRLFGDRTRILISHRPSTLLHCDVRLHLQDGAIAAISSTACDHAA